MQTGDQAWTVRSAADLGRALSGVRAASGLTQAQLAEELGLHRSYVAKMENGPPQLLLERALLALRRMGATVTINLPGTDEP